MWWIVEGILAVVALVPVLFILAMCRILRRAGQPDVAGERVMWFCAGWIVLRCITLIAMPGIQPPWLVLGSVVPTLLACLGLAAVRVYRRPEILGAVFSPATVRRLRDVRDRLRR